MIYKFRRYEVQPTLAYPSSSIYRPVIPVWVGTRGSPRKPFFGLLDTGSDDTKLPLSVAESLGVPLDRAHPVRFRGVGGEAVGFYGEIVLELRQSPRSWVWATHVAFLPDPEGAAGEDRLFITLGHAGFFRFFHASFDYQRGRVKVRPNGLFRGLPG